MVMLCLFQEKYNIKRPWSCSSSLTSCCKVYICCLTLPIFVHWTNHMLCCAVLGSDWREVEAALDRLVSQEREVATGDSQKGIHNGLSVLCACFRDCMWEVCDSLEGVATFTVTEAYTQGGACRKLYPVLCMSYSLSWMLVGHLHAWRAV